MSILGGLMNLLKPAGDLIDDLHTSTEEKLALKAELAKIQAGVVIASLDYEKSITDARAIVITAEAKSESWITRSWRPLTMVSFVLIMWLGVIGWVDLTEFSKAPPELWKVIMIGLGGYMPFRTAEKITSQIVAAQKAREQT
jgi:hypothetical protein